MKCGRPMGSKDKNPQKRKGINDQDNGKFSSWDPSHNTWWNLLEVQTYENNEISMNYVSTGKRWDRTNIVIDNIFAYNVVIETMQ